MFSQVSVTLFTGKSAFPQCHRAGRPSPAWKWKNLDSQGGMHTCRPLWICQCSGLRVCDSGLGERVCIWCTPPASPATPPTHLWSIYILPPLVYTLLSMVYTSIHLWYKPSNLWCTSQPLDYTHCLRREYTPLEYTPNSGVHPTSGVHPCLWCTPPLVDRQTQRSNVFHHFCLSICLSVYRTLFLVN